jgi:hypothetical protein
MGTGGSTSVLGVNLPQSPDVNFEDGNRLLQGQGRVVETDGSGI